MAPPIFHSQVYLKIVEGKELKGVESNGTSDPFVEIQVEGKKRDNLVTKRVDKTVAPKWNQEFVFSVSSPSAEITFRVFDWNRVLSNVLLGTASLTLNNDLTNRVQNVWLPLNTQGSINVIYHITPYSAPPAGATQHLNLRMPQLRLQLENTLYYPGQIVRGAVSYGLLKPKKIRIVRLELDGRSYVHWASGGKHKTHYRALVVYFNSTTVLSGSFDDKQVAVMEPGSYLFAFEYVLPINLPCSINDKSSSYMVNYNRYWARAYVDCVGSADKVATMTFRVLPSAYQQTHLNPMSSMALRADGGLTKVQAITCVVTGPAMVRCGEKYTFNCRIENRGQKAIEQLDIRLVAKAWLNARVHGFGSWVRREIVGALHFNEAPLSWPLKDLPQFPVAPGADWTGDITIQIPTQGLGFTLHANFSPLIQRSHFLKVKFITTGNVLTKASGETKFPVIVGPGPNQFPGMAPPPPEPMGPTGITTIAPGSFALYESIIPTISLDGKTVVCAGKSIGDVPAMPGASQPPQSIVTIGKDFSWVKECLVTSEDWTPGTTPSWVKNDDGLKPDEEFFDMSPAGPM